MTVKKDILLKSTTISPIKPCFWQMRDTRTNPRTPPGQCPSLSPSSKDVQRRCPRISPCIPDSLQASPKVARRQPGRKTLSKIRTIAIAISTGLGIGILPIDLGRWFSECAVDIDLIHQPDTGRGEDFHEDVVEDDAFEEACFLSFVSSCIYGWSRWREQGRERVYRKYNSPSNTASRRD